MKQTILVIAAAVVCAVAGHAATISLDLDAASYQVGDQITLTATLTTDGTEIIEPFRAFGISVAWDPAVAHVANGYGPYGSSTQMVTSGPGAGGHNLTASGTALLGSANPTCANTLFYCAMITQVFPLTGAPTVMDPQTLIGTLVLQADAGGDLGLSIRSLTLGNIGDRYNEDPSVVELGPNWLAGPDVIGEGSPFVPPSKPPATPPTSPATPPTNPALPPASGGSVGGSSPIPEPSSALLFGVGALGLHIALRRR